MGTAEDFSSFVTEGVVAGFAGFARFAAGAATGFWTERGSPAEYATGAINDTKSDNDNTGTIVWNLVFILTILSCRYS
jgi:hypothetical protein